MYNELNDYELIYMVKENEDNFGMLCDKYRPLINKYAYKYIKVFKNMGYEVEDLIQLGYMALYRTTKYYSMQNNNLYYTYLNKAIMNAYRLEYRKCLTLKYKTLNNYVCYDNLVPNTNYPYLDILGTNEDFDEQSLLIDFKNSLDFLDSCIFELRYNGYHLKEISQLLGVKYYVVKKKISLIKREIVYI